MSFATIRTEGDLSLPTTFSLLKLTHNDRELWSQAHKSLRIVGSGQRASYAVLELASTLVTFYSDVQNVLCWYSEWAYHFKVNYSAFQAIELSWFEKDLDDAGCSRDSVVKLRSESGKSMEFRPLLGQQFVSLQGQPGFEGQFCYVTLPLKKVSVKFTKALFVSHARS